MTPAHSAKNRTRRYRYYTCTSAQKRGWHTCPSKSIPAGEIERFVIEQIRRIGKEPALWQQTLADASAQPQARQAELETERSVIERDVRLWMTEMRVLALEVGQSPSGAVVARLSDIQERIRAAEERTRAIDDEKLSFAHSQVHENEGEQALAGLDAEWETLSPREQARIVQLLVERVDYDGAAQTVSITFHPGGIQTLADDVAERQKGKSA
jgi:site-specific DNA recombinase